MEGGNEGGGRGKRESNRGREEICIMFVIVLCLMRRFFGRF